MTEANTATLLAALEAMVAGTKAQQADGLGRQYGYHSIGCFTCPYRLRLEYQAADDTDHIHSWPLCLEVLPAHTSTSQHFKQVSEAAEAMAVAAQSQAEKCQVAGCAGLATISASASGTSQKSEEWQAAWQAAKEAITGRAG